MKPLATIPQTLPPHGVRFISDKAWQMPECIRLELGEPDFRTPEHIVEAAVQAAREGFTKYTPNSGIADLREAIAAKAGRDQGLEVDPAQVCVHPGAVTGIASAMMALIDPGDEVLVPGLSWPNGEMSLRLLHGVPVHYPVRPERDFLPDPAEVERLITPRTKALFLNSPGNPTGAVFPEELVRELADLCRRHDLWLISDEIYEHITFGRPHISPARFAPERTIIISGFSKAYAMTGWRLGYTISPPQVARVITKLQEPLVSNANSLAQRAGIAALTSPQECVARMREAYRRRRDIALAILKEHGLYRYTPQGAFYLMVDVSAISRDSVAVALALLEEEKVSVAPGDAFGRDGAGLVRVSLASSEENVREGVTRICRFLERKTAGREALSNSRG